MHFPGALSQCTTNLTKILGSPGGDAPPRSPRTFQSTLIMAKNFCFSRLWFLKNLNEQRWDALLWKLLQCVCVRMNVSVCVMLFWQRCPSVLLDFNSPTSRGPRTGRSEPFEVWCFAPALQGHQEGTNHMLAFLAFQDSSLCSIR